MCIRDRLSTFRKGDVRLIYLYSGTPGSGKSLHTARDIRDALGPKRLPVIANFEINEKTKGYKRFTYMPNDLSLIHI